MVRLAKCVAWLKASRRGLAILAFCLVNIVLLLMSFRMYPIERGNAADFFKTMYDVGSGKRLFRGIYPSQDGFCFYFAQGMHEQFLYRVPLEEAEAALPSIRSIALKESGTGTPSERNLLARGAGLNELIIARLAAEREGSAQVHQDAGAYHDLCQRAFLNRWDRVRRYWANVLFETLFFNAGLLLICQVLGAASLPWRAACAGMLPIYLFSPCYLGYCSWALTSSGPVGGILYPFILALTYGDPVKSNALDDLLLQWMPKPLERLTQGGYGEITPVLMDGLSPTFTLTFGSALGMVVFFAGRALSRPHAMET